MSTDVLLSVRTKAVISKRVRNVTTVAVIPIGEIQCSPMSANPQAAVHISRETPPEQGSKLMQGLKYS
jgi:hypothetical protein